MDTAPPPADDLHDALLGETRTLIGGLIGELTRALSSGQPGPRTQRWMVRHLLVPAEALMRRALRLIAQTMTLPPPRPRRAAAPLRSKPARAPAPRKLRAPVFRLAESLPRPRQAYLPEHLRPRISIIGLPPLVPVRAAPKRPPRATKDALTRLTRRIDALRLAFEDPAPSARRLLRRRMIRAGRPKLTLSYYRPPGLKAAALNGIGRDTFLRVNDAALNAELRAPDSS